MILNQEQEQIRDAVRAFAQAELWPNAARWDKEHTFPKEAHKGLAQLGAYGICVPEEFGGPNLDYLTLALVIDEIAAGDGDTSTAVREILLPIGRNRAHLISDSFMENEEARQQHMCVDDNGHVVFFVITMRDDEAVRVISMRRAHENERIVFQQRTGYVEGTP